MPGTAIIFDHVNKVVIQVAGDPESQRRFEEIVAAQSPSKAGTHTS